MNHYREMASTFLTKLPWKQDPAVTQLSRSLRSPAPQTSPIFELPYELILSILSHISPEPQFTGHYARFRIQYDLIVDDRHRLRMGFLRPLSMTCKAMRLLLIPFIWEHLRLFPRRWVGGRDAVLRFETLLSALRADMSLAIAVKVVSVDASFESAFPLFVECLQSLPNLHTLEIRWSDNDDYFEELLEPALKWVKLPQIKTLIIPPSAHPFLEHCPELEDVNFVVVKGRRIRSDVILESLTSNWNSKIRRLAVPLFLWGNPSRFVAACPKLTELTIIYPHPAQTHRSEMATLTEPIRMTRSAMLELVNACRELPDFDTFQIVYFPNAGPLPETSFGHWWGRGFVMGDQPLIQQPGVRKGARDVKDLLMDCLKLTGMKATLRFIELESEFSEPIHLDSVKVEECEV